MSHVSFNNNVANFNQVGGGYNQADIGNLGSSKIPGSSGPLDGQNDQITFRLQSGGSDVYIVTQPADFKHAEGATAIGPDGGFITLTGDVSSKVAKYKIRN